MNELSKYLVEQILLEDDNPIEKIVVIYVGRFQPFHKGHYGTYQHLVKKFGKDNVFIGTSNKTEKPKSPFNFKEKVKIMNTMFGIPTSKIQQVKNPYKPTEILSKFDENKTAFVTVVGEKDKNRLGGKYFTPFKGKIDEPYKDRGYVYAAPSSGGGVSGTEVRNGLSVGSDEQKEDFFKNRAYGRFNKSIFKMITDKLNEGIYIPKKIIEDWLITEGTRTATGQTDDGPNSFFPNFNTFSKINVDRATKIGYQVLDMVMSKDLEDYYEHPIYPNGPVKATSFFPAGVIGKTTAANQIDIYSSSAYTDWYKHVTKKAALIGYELIDKLGNDEDREESTDGAIDIKKVEKEFDTSLNENINIPVKVGDTILTGRFKNKKTVVKSIGKDEHGMPTINGKKVVTFRIVKEGYIAELAGTAVRCEKCNHSWEIELEDTEKYLCHSCGWDSQQQEYDFDKFDSWREKMGLNESGGDCSKRLPNETQEQYRTRCFGYNPLTPPPSGMVQSEQLAKGMSLRDIAEKHDVSFEELSKEAKKGVKVEIEHTSDVKQAYDIAKDHLFEDPKYYTKLATIEELAPHGYPDQEWMDNHEKKMKKLRKQLDSMNEGILNEGGAYGHMNHPFDTEINLTFGDLKDIVNRALEGNLELTREKTDGQALAISWRDGRLVAARNKGHLKNKGENALDIKGVADKFRGRGELEKAYNFAMNDLSKAIKSLSEKQRDKIFKGGACFMNLEVIYPTSVNVIPYGQALLVFHGTMEYNDDGVAIGENQEAARILAGMIKQVNKDVQDNYTIQGPPVIKLPKNQDLSSKKGKYTSQISKLQKEFGLKDTDGVAEYHQAWWSNWIDKNSPKTLDNKTKMGLVKRWAFFDKSFRLDNKNITDEKVLEWAKKHEKDNHQKIAKQNLMKFENIFLGLGAEVLEFTSSVLTVNPEKAVRDIKKRIDKTIKDVQKSGDPKKVEKLKLELKRLQSIGGPDKIVPNEGIVFQYKGNTFKLTGTFASVNQLLGIFF